MSGQDQHVLLIDDDPDMHDVVRLILEPLGYRVTCCLTAQTGLEALRRERPDVLLLDIMLTTPTEGLSLAREIKDDDDLQAIPIIVISAIGQSFGEDYAREVGAGSVPIERFMEKPLDARDLRQTIDQVLKARP